MSVPITERWKIVMIKKVFLFMILAVVLVISSCKTDHHTIKNEEKDNKKPDKLVVYLSAAPHGFIDAKEVNDDNITFLYPSKHIVGMRMVGGEIECKGGNIFEQALQEYSDQKGINIEVHYIEEHRGVEDIFQGLYEMENLPDLVLMNKHAQYDYYRLAEQGLLLDFFPYMEEGIYDEELYYQKIIHGGIVKQKQIVLPILFNINGLITSTDYLQEIGQEEPGFYCTYEEILNLLKKSCEEMEQSHTKEAIFETSGLLVGGRYIPSILTGAAYPSYFDSDLINLEISQKTVLQILDVMQSYNRQEFNINSGWEGKAYEENICNADITSRHLATLENGLYRDVGIFLSGGRSGGMNFHNSLLMDAAYFNTKYKESNTEMILCGIPTVKDSQAYSANITLFAAAFSTTEYPEYVYDLVQYMMDYSFPMSYGFSVNKGNTDSQLQMIQKTTFSLYSDSIWSSIAAGFKTKEEIKNDIEILDPLDKDTVETVQYILDHLGGAGLPFSILEYDIYNAALKAVGNKNASNNEISEWIIEQLNEYLSLYDLIDPFADISLNYSR